MFPHDEILCIPEWNTTQIRIYLFLFYHVKRRMMVPPVFIDDTISQGVYEFLNWTGMVSSLAICK